MIQARGLTKRSGSNAGLVQAVYKRAEQVDDLSFTVEPGKVTGFLGRTALASPRPCT